MENLTYITDTEGRETAVIEGRLRFQRREADGQEVLYRSVPKDSGWSDYHHTATTVQGRQDFHERMIDIAQHHVDLRDHSRRGESVQTNVNYDIALYRIVYGEGVALYLNFEERTEPGFKLEPEVNLRIPVEGRHRDGWYPLHVEGCKVAAFVPEMFTTFEVSEARGRVARQHPYLAGYLENTALKRTI